MSKRRGIRRPASRLRSAAGAALAMLGVLIAVGVGALMITSMSASRAMRPPSFAAPCAETDSGLWVQTARRTSHVLRPATCGATIEEPRCCRDSQQPKRLIERRERRCPSTLPKR